MINGVIYARYSSHNQREESIDGQLRKCRQYAKDHQIKVIAEYCDRAISGRTDNRSEFQRMIADAQKGKFEIIIMYTLDRFARNRYDAAMYKAKLKKNGVRLVYTEQEITTEPEGIILESVLEGMAEYYSQNLARGVKRGMRENALKAEITGGARPLGYKRGLNDKYEIDPATAPAIKYIFENIAAGKRQKEVVDALNRQGYKTSRGVSFTYNSLDSILHNPRYYGLYKFKDIEVENGIPAIVTKELWEKCQHVIKHSSRKSDKFKNPVNYILTGKLTCGLCGGSIVGESGTGRSKKIFYYYKCINRKHTGKCKKKTIKKEVLEKLVVDVTAAEVLTPENIEKIAARAIVLANKDNSVSERATALRNEIKRQNDAIKRLLDLVASGVTISDIQTKINEMDRLRSDAQLELDQLENDQPIKITKDEIIRWLNSFLAGNHNDPDFQQKIIDTLVSQVVMFDDHIVIGFNLTGKKVSKINLTDGSNWESMAAQNRNHSNRLIIKNVLFVFVEIQNG